MRRIRRNAEQRAVKPRRTGLGKCFSARSAYGAVPTGEIGVCARPYTGTKKAMRCFDDDHRVISRSGNNIKFGKADRRYIMGRGILLWFLGIPIPLIILIMLFWR